MFTSEGTSRSPPIHSRGDRPDRRRRLLRGRPFGYLDSLGDPDPSDDAFRAAAVYGSVLASFAVEDFGTERVQRLTEDEVSARFAEFKRMMTFDEPVRA